MNLATLAVTKEIAILSFATSLARSKLQILIVAVCSERRLWLQAWGLGS